ncbi:hypothetical protein GCM10023188_16060 [Pontibacter saemangeumensis]|uniref:Glycosyl-4,4'-diaponeurosporenoate acyltransferase n=1 Tax=Pontibacter saemangeumensis TaxID=1084525 RepID=A0ABP8LHR9_9BACT
MGTRGTQAKKQKRAAGWYNAIPNLLWSVLAFVPIYIFCYTLLDRKLLYAFLAFSIFTLFLPKAFFRHIQLGKTVAIYKQAGVPFISRFTQNGQIINRLLRKQYPRHRVVSGSRLSVNRRVQQTYAYEKFHFMLFSFFSLVFIYALIKDYIGWALLLLLTNMIYNVYPCLLQQYIRVRLIPFLKSNNG